MLQLILLVALLFAFDPNCFGQASPREADSVVEADLCEVITNPGKFDKKLLRLTGFTSWGFEDASFSSPTCKSKGSSPMWMEYGGTSAAGTIYCCGVSAERTRKEPLVVEGINVPLTEDDEFRKFNKLVHQSSYSTVRATVVGRFFAGEKVEDGKSWGAGYGHMGCCTLLVIQKVEKVYPVNDALDWRSLPNDSEFVEKFSNYRNLDVPDDKQVIADQKTADEGEQTWRFSDHRRVVFEKMKATASVNEQQLGKLKMVRNSAGRVIYTLKEGEQKFVITVARPYWLSFYAAEPEKVIWTIVSIVKSPY